jgi:acyl dehydratase
MPILDQELRLSEIRQGVNLPPVIKNITQRDINLYAEASRDFNPIHIDEEFAAKTPLGGTIAHGMLILAYVSEMMTNAFGKKWISTGKMAMRFKAPARPKDTITISGIINSIEHKGDDLYAACNVEARNQNGEIVVTGETMVKL